jgi:hypothetical protein
MRIETGVAYIKSVKEFLDSGGIASQVLWRSHVVEEN